MQNMTRDEFFEQTRALREGIGSLRESVAHRLMEARESSDTPLLEKKETQEILKRNVVSLINMRIKYRSIQSVSEVNLDSF